LVLKTITGKQIRRILSLLIVISVFLTEMSSVFAFEVPSVDAQKFPIEIYGDYLEYRTKAEQVVTKGKAYISYKDMKISAENIQANTKTEDIFAQGNVDFWRCADQAES
jgi:lipopolysaccharide assembly outer membrane protein LptD (OstA)